jgi:hypothetical protein
MKLLRTDGAVLLAATIVPGTGAIALSERNGDKSRFGRLRKKKILRRKLNRELRAGLSASGPRATAPQKNLPTAAK